MDLCFANIEPWMLFAFLTKYFIKYLRTAAEFDPPVPIFLMQYCVRARSLGFTVPFLIANLCRNTERAPMFPLGEIANLRRECGRDLRGVAPRSPAIYIQSVIIIIFESIFEAYPDLECRLGMAPFAIEQARSHLTEEYIQRLDAFAKTPAGSNYPIGALQLIDVAKRLKTTWLTWRAFDRLWTGN